MRRLPLLALLFVSTQLCFNEASTQIVNRTMESLDEYIENARVQWEVPGLSVAVVKDGVVLLSKGYGEAKLGTGRVVDEHTIFSVGSTTKAMVAAATAMLVDEGKVHWDDRVVDHLPTFALYDPYVTREVRVRDLFTHNTGLGNTDLLWVLWDYSTEEILRRMRQEPLSYSFRGGYTYQNIMYATAGLLIEHLSGMTWDRFVEERLFKPLDMDKTFTLKSKAFNYPNRSVPHYKWDDKIEAIVDSNADSIGAAGSVWSCASDISKWIRFVLDSARVDGIRLISEASFAELHRPQIIIPVQQFYPTAQLTKPSWTTYSLGWFQHDYRGRYVQFHTGSLNGTVAIIGLLPSENTGVYVFGNLDHAEVRHAIMYKVFDHFTGDSNRDWSTDIYDLYRGFDEASKKSLELRDQERVRGTSTTLEMTDYTGEYTNAFLGVVSVRINQKGQLTIDFRQDRQMTLNHWHFDTFLGKIDQYPFSSGSLVSFQVNESLVPALMLYGEKFTRSN